jgi:alginate O-acetyltransferase complex protein AlgI
MLFNSYAFIFGFLPVTLVGYFLLGRVRTTYAAVWLAAASLFFYGYWAFEYIPLLLASIAFNYMLGARIVGAVGERQRRTLLIAGVVCNLALLGFFKYFDFFLTSVASATGSALSPLGIVLPLGISFFTFTQIAYLADAREGKAQEYSFANYVLFVTYFPHLIAGPILHHREMMPQFSSALIYRLSKSNIAVGSAIFTLGLAKKLLLADNLAVYANDLFEAPGEPTFFVAWGGVLAYTFQLYFDFSGYSDMAIGLSRLFGVQLPLNFNSPYKATSIADFWRRWHMTLSRFLREYLYVRLGGNRRGPGRRYINLMLTMLLGGLWHGAGWTYIVWGGLHGLYLVINHAWTHARKSLGWSANGRAWRLAATALTFLAVVFAWVFFRAASLGDAQNIVAAMLGINGVALPATIVAGLGGVGEILTTSGIGSYLGGGQRLIETFAWIFVGALIAFWAPNTQQIMARYEPALDFDPKEDANPRAAREWRPSVAWSVALGLLAAACVLSLNRPTEFLYFQF